MYLDYPNMTPELEELIYIQHTYPKLEDHTDRERDWFNHLYHMQIIKATKNIDKALWLDYRIEAAKYHCDNIPCKHTSFSFSDDKKYKLVIANHHTEKQAYTMQSIRVFKTKADGKWEYHMSATRHDILRRIDWCSSHPKGVVLILNVCGKDFSIINVDTKERTNYFVEDFLKTPILTAHPSPEGDYLACRTSEGVFVYDFSNPTKMRWEKVYMGYKEFVRWETKNSFYVEDFTSKEETGPYTKEDVALCTVPGNRCVSDKSTLVTLSK